MAREKITAYVPPDLALALKRVAAAKDRSLSDVVEDALARTLLGASLGVEHGALIAKLDMIGKRLGALEQGQETLFEFTAHAARFAMSVAPEVLEADHDAANARGAERFRSVIATIVRRIAAGKSLWREQFTAANGDANAPRHEHGAARARPGGGA